MRLFWIFKVNEILQNVFSNFNGMKLENHNKMMDGNLKISQTYKS